MSKIILSIFFCTALVFSQSKKVFVPYFRAASNTKIDRATCGTLADMFAAKLKESSGWDVITEGDISSMLEQEERKKMVDCTEGSCMQEIAGAVGAPYLISGNIAVAGGTTIINISLVDIRNGVTKEKVTAMASTVDELLLKFDGMAEKIGGKSQSVVVQSDKQIPEKWTSVQVDKVRKTPEDYGMKLITAGTFQMGSSNGVAIEQPVHSVMVSSFYIDSTEVTQKEYRRLMRANPSQFTGDNKPVEQVGWWDAIKYCNARSREAGLVAMYNESTGECNFSAKGYRLPTEAEWEYACRAGTNENYYGTVDNIGWYTSNSGNTTHDVASKQKNSFGLYDMGGNVREWCNDWYGSYSSSSLTDPRGPSTGSYRVRRGGSWYGNPTHLRSAYRGIDPSISRSNLGFRCVLAL